MIGVSVRLGLIGVKSAGNGSLRGVPACLHSSVEPPPDIGLDGSDIFTKTEP